MMKQLLIIYLFLIGNNQQHDARDIAITRSDDGGQTWSPVRVLFQHLIITLHRVQNLRHLVPEGLLAPNTASKP
jgi:hypothetical protein